MKEKIIGLSNNIFLNYLYSENNAPTVLFLHVSGGALRMWSGIFPLFQERFQLIAPDFRSHGKSSRPIGWNKLYQEMLECALRKS